MEKPLRWRKGFLNSKTGASSNRRAAPKQTVGSDLLVETAVPAQKPERLASKSSGCARVVDGGPRRHAATSSGTGGVRDCHVDAVVAGVASEVVLVSSSESEPCSADFHRFASAGGKRGKQGGKVRRDSDRGPSSARGVLGHDDVQFVPSSPEKPAAAEAGEVQPSVAKGRGAGRARGQHRGATPLRVEGKMADGRVGKMIQERRQGHAATRALHCKDASLRKEVRNLAVGGVGAAVAAIASPMCRLNPLLVPFVLDVFAGAMIFADMAKTLGFFVVSIDIVFGPDHDLTSPKVANQIIGWIHAGLVIFAHFGVCCKSWSRARGIPIGPQPLRSMEHVLGLPDLRHERERWKIINGNKLMSFTARAFSACIRMLVPAGVENPWSSYIWDTVPFQHLAKRKAVRVVRADFCKFGSPWMKPTRLMLAFCQTGFLEKRCRPLGCICSRSGKPHVRLVGVSRPGVFATVQAEKYPRPFARALAKTYQEAALRLENARICEILDGK